MSEHRTIEAIQRYERGALSHYVGLPTHSSAADKKMIRLNRRFIPFLRRAGLLNEGARVLDIGCGTGWLVEMFRRAGYEAHGGDILPVEVRRQRFPLANFHMFDVFDPPHDHRRYDFVFIRALGPIEKLADWAGLELFHWIGRHLSASGVLYFINGSDGSGVPDPYRANQTSDVVLSAARQAAPILYWNDVVTNMTVVCGNGREVPAQPHKAATRYMTAYRGPQIGSGWIQGLPILMIPTDDIWVETRLGNLSLADRVLLLRTYPELSAKIALKRLGTSATRALKYLRA